MKVTFATAAVLASIASAHPLTSRDTASETENGWSQVLAGDSSACADLAVIFARGTFDPGNVGPWVGAPFYNALVAQHSSVSFQGVDASAYPADLAGYIVEGGSQDCANSLGAAVNTYATTCPNAKIAVSGWSQGALCARKSFGVISEAAAAKVSAFVTFGDPYQVWSDSVTFPAVPSGAAQIGFCKSAPTDPLCGDALANWPTTTSGVISHLKDIWESVDEASMNNDQKSALASLIVELPEQAVHQLTTLASDLLHGHLQRWMLTPQHFWYGMDGSVESAAEQVFATL